MKIMFNVTSKSGNDRFEKEINEKSFQEEIKKQKEEIKKTKEHYKTIAKLDKSITVTAYTIKDKTIILFEQLV